MSSWPSNFALFTSHHTHTHTNTLSLTRSHTYTHVHERGGRRKETEREKGNLEFLSLSLSHSLSRKNLSRSLPAHHRCQCRHHHHKHNQSSGAYSEKGITPTLPHFILLSSRNPSIDGVFRCSETTIGYLTRREEKKCACVTQSLPFVTETVERPQNAAKRRRYMSVWIL